LDFVGGMLVGLFLGGVCGFITLALLVASRDNYNED
jgi:gas vesicle protein